MENKEILKEEEFLNGFGERVVFELIMFIVMEIFEINGKVLFFNNGVVS